MKVVRSDATTFEAKQGKASSIVIAVFLVLAGGGVLALEILQPAGTAKQNAWVGVVVGLVFVIVGVLAFLFSRSIHLLADRNTQTVNLTFRSVLRGKAVNCSFADVARVSETSTVATEGNNQQVIQLLLKDGSALVIPATRSSFSINGIPLGMFARHADIGQQLATFMNVPFEPLGFGSVAGIQNSVVEAINAVKVAQGQAPISPTVVPPPAAAQPTPEPAIGMPDQPGYAALRSTESTPPPVEPTQPPAVEPTAAVPPSAASDPIAPPIDPNRPGL